MCARRGEVTITPRSTVRAPAASPAPLSRGCAGGSAPPTAPPTPPLFLSGRGVRAALSKEVSFNSRPPSPHLWGIKGAVEAEPGKGTTPPSGPRAGVPGAKGSLPTAIAAPLPRARRRWTRQGKAAAGGTAAAAGRVWGTGSPPVRVVLIEHPPALYIRSPAESGQTPSREPALRRGERYSEGASGLRGTACSSKASRGAASLLGPGDTAPTRLFLGSWGGLASGPGCFQALGGKGGERGRVPPGTRQTFSAEGGRGTSCVGGKRGSTRDAVSGRGCEAVGWVAGEIFCPESACSAPSEGGLSQTSESHQPGAQRAVGAAGQQRGSPPCSGQRGSFCGKETHPGTPEGPAETPRPARDAQRRFVLIETKK